MSRSLSNLLPKLLPKLLIVVISFPFICWADPPQIPEDKQRNFGVLDDLMKEKELHCEDKTKKDRFSFSVIHVPEGYYVPPKGSLGGKEVSEIHQVYVGNFIVVALGGKRPEDGSTVVVIPADGLEQGVNGKAFKATLSASGKIKPDPGLSCRLD